MKSKYATVIISDSAWTDLEQTFDVLSWSVYSDVAIYVQEYGIGGWGSSITVEPDNSYSKNTAIQKIRIKSLSGNATVNYSLLGFIAFRTGGIAGIQRPIVTKDNDYTITSEDYTILLDGSSNTVTLTLPSAVTLTGIIYNLKCIDDTFTCDIATDGSETLDDDSANFELIKDEVITIQSDSSGWRII